MTFVDPYDLAACGSDSDDAHRAAIDAAIHDDDGPLRIGLDPYPAEEPAGRTLNAHAYWSRHIGTGLASVHRPRRAA